MLGALLIAVLDTAHAGVWVQGPGEAWLQGSVSASTSSSLHDASGARTPATDPSLFGPAGVLFDSGRYVGVDVAAYEEVGLGKGVEVVASFPGRLATQRWTWAGGSQPPIVQRNLGFGELAAGARVGTTTAKGLALSLYGGGRAPLYDNHPRVLRTAPANGDFYDDRVPLGQGALEAEALGGIGTGTGPLPRRVGQGPPRRRQPILAHPRAGRAGSPVRPMVGGGLRVPGRGGSTLGRAHPRLPGAGVVRPPSREVPMRLVLPVLALMACNSAPTDYRDGRAPGPRPPTPARSTPRASPAAKPTPGSTASTAAPRRRERSWYWWMTRSSPAAGTSPPPTPA